MMRKSRTDRAGAVTRRQALTGAAAALGTVLSMRKSGGVLAEEGAKVCILTPEAVQGPFYFDPNLVRGDITEGKPGVPLKLALRVVEAEDCAGAKGARVDVWHADGLGAYSGYAGQETGSTKGETFLRGTQFADADGQVQFNTIYPGWYPGRAPHIHFKVLLGDADLVTGQLYFPDDVIDRIYAANQPYRARERRDTTNADDFIFRRQGGADTLANVTEEGAGICRATLVIGIARGARLSCLCRFSVRLDHLLRP